MGWKNIKEHYNILHIVTVREKGICIGSSYVHDIAVINPDTGVVTQNLSLRGIAEEYPELFNAKPEEILKLIKSPDSFDISLIVYTYEGGHVVEKQCEEYGYPNVTHDGLVMYKNTFSEDIGKVTEWAINDAKAGARYYKDEIKKAEKKLIQDRELLKIEMQNIARLEGS